MYLSPWKFFRNQILLDYLGRWRNQSCQIFFQSDHSGVSGKGSKFAIFSAKRRWPLQLLYYRTTVIKREWIRGWISWLCDLRNEEDSEAPTQHTCFSANDTELRFGWDPSPVIPPFEQNYGQRKVNIISFWVCDKTDDRRCISEAKLTEARSVVQNQKTLSNIFHKTWLLFFLEEHIRGHL